LSVLVIARALRSPVDYPLEEEEAAAKENKVAKTRAGREEGEKRSALMRFSSLGVMVIYSRRG